MPPEWWPHEATWLSWPHNRETWPWQLPDVEEAMAQLVRVLAPHEQVYINVRDEEHRQHVQSLLTLLPEMARNVHLPIIPTNDAWIRDYGAITVFEQSPAGWQRIALNWGYNAWGGKYPPWDLDNHIPCEMARRLHIPCEEAPLILEGGSIEVNGKGLLLTTTSCLLHPSRNPGYTQEEITSILRTRLGVREVLWLEGELEGDDTDGHIDQLVRFVSPTTLLVVTERDPSAKHYYPLQEMRQQLNRYAQKHGLELIDLPLPEPVFIQGQRMPASYANFYIANEIVAMPTFGVPGDAHARALLQRLFPSRKVVGIYCRELIWGLGALHCLTQQIPAPLFV